MVQPALKTRGSSHLSPPVSKMALEIKRRVPFSNWSEMFPVHARCG